ncbi:hypothetical protein BBG47_23790 [Paenibacillus sp. KS1]|nr:hypothetical protein BBG47_23790 [Paenibacillus sp. KS1]
MAMKIKLILILDGYNRIFNRETRFSAKKSYRYHKMSNMSVSLLYLKIKKRASMKNALFVTEYIFYP